MNDMNNNTQKFQIGDKVKVIKGIFKGEVGTVKCIADFRLYNRLTYRVRLDTVKTDKGYYKEEAFVSYELEKYDESVQNTCELNKNETCTKQKIPKLYMSLIMIRLNHMQNLKAIWVFLLQK